MADADLGSSLLNQGISQGLADYGKINANGKIADSVVKTNPEVLQELGMDPDQFAGMSAQDKSATVTGYFQAQGAKQHAQMVAAQLQDYMSQADERKSQGAWRAAQAARQAQQDAEDAASGDALKRYYSTPDVSTYGAGDPNDPQTQMAQGGGYATGSAPASPGARMANAMSTPGLGGRSATALYKTIMQYGDASGDANAPIVSPGPYDGVSLVTDRRTGATHVVTNPANAVQPLTDADGNVVPGGYVTRGGVRFAPTAKPVDASLVASRQQSALTQWHKRLDPIQTQVEFAAEKANDPAATSADKAKYGAMLPALTAQRDAVLKERPGQAGDSAADDNTPVADGSSRTSPAVPGSKTEFDKLPSGAWFVNPADKRVLQKK